MSSINAIPDPQLGLLVTSGDNTATLNFQTNSITALKIDSSQNANCTNTGSFCIPVGTTAQRPASPVNGMIRFNTNNNAIEGYANNIWVGFQVALPSVNTVAPVISGSAAIGGTLTSTTGTWTNSPTSYTYQWLANSVSITNATSNTFTVTSTQLNAYITCNVSAINSAGPSTPATSNSVGPATTTYAASALLVAGGGGGGSALGGGGGGGGVISISSVTLVPATTYSFVVGGGGASQASGGSTTAFGATAAGGGTSGPHDSSDGTAGGSGGGAASNNSRINVGGASSGNSLGNNAGTIYGNAGGSMTTARTGTPTRAAGGGGAGGAGLNTNSNIVVSSNDTGYSAGGVGINSSITGSILYYAGGGGGGAYYNGYAGNGGIGGGGAGSCNGGLGPALGGVGAANSGANGLAGDNLAGGAGGANTGGGGGGGSWSSGPGGAGGSGVFILSVPTSYYTGTTTGSPAVTTSGSNTILRFTSSGSYTA